MTIALELQQLKKTYPGGVQALRGIDLQVEAGIFTRFWGQMEQEIDHHRYYQLIG